VVIVQTDALLPYSTVIVAPTSTAARRTDFRPEIRLQRTRTRVVVDQLAALDLDRLAIVSGGFGAASSARSTARWRLSSAWAKGVLKAGGQWMIASSRPTSATPSKPLPNPANAACHQRW
jgi:mRNA-degrading endonuclease toxin of MazEF toxin-antitoxin module